VPTGGATYLGDARLGAFPPGEKRNFAPSSASLARRSIATWTHEAHTGKMGRSSSGGAGGRKGWKPDRQPLRARAGRDLFLVDAGKMVDGLFQSRLQRTAHMGS
jgi:hypothetical protein